MRKIVLALSVIVVAILTITIITPSVHDERMAKIHELQLEALDEDSTKYAVTQRDIDSLLKRVDKEYSITDDHEIRLTLIEERHELESANLYNDVKKVLMDYDRLLGKLSYESDIDQYQDVPIDPGICSRDRINPNVTQYLDVSIDPGRCL